MRVYFSHSIRGKWGTDCTEEQMAINCNLAKIATGKLRKELPGVDVYLPAEHEDFVHRAYKSGYVTEEQILDVDCQIIDDCDACVVLVPAGDELQGGRLVEFNHCIDTNTPVQVFRHMHTAVDFIKGLMNSPLKVGDRVTVIPSDTYYGSYLGKCGTIKKAATYYDWIIEFDDYDVIQASFNETELKRI